MAKATSPAYQTLRRGAVSIVGYGVVATLVPEGQDFRSVKPGPFGSRSVTEMRHPSWATGPTRAEEEGVYHNP